MIERVTEPDPMENNLRRAMTDAARGYQPSPAPVQDILDAGRTLRARRRVATAAAGTVLMACLGTATAWLSGSPGGNHAPEHPAMSAASPSREAVVSQVVGSGMVDGRSWSVTAEFHPTLPAGYRVPAKPGETGEMPVGKSLLCRRTVIDGVRTDHEAGLWSRCRVVDGTGDPTGQSSAELAGDNDKGLSDIRIYVGHPGLRVAYAVITLDTGRRLTAPVRTLPGTRYSTFAIPLGKGQTIATVDHYDERGRRLARDTSWR